MNLSNKLTEKPAGESLWASIANESSVMVVNGRVHSERLHSCHRCRYADDDEDKHHKNNCLWKKKHLFKYENNISNTSNIYNSEMKKAENYLVHGGVDVGLWFSKKKYSVSVVVVRSSAELVLMKRVLRPSSLYTCRIRSSLIRNCCFLIFQLVAAFLFNFQTLPASSRTLGFPSIYSIHVNETQHYTSFCCVHPLWTSCR